MEDDRRKRWEQRVGERRAAKVVYTHDPARKCPACGDPWIRTVGVYQLRGLDEPATVESECKKHGHTWKA